MRKLILELERIRDAKSRATDAINLIVGCRCVVVVYANVTTTDPLVSVIKVAGQHQDLDFVMEENGVFNIDPMQSLSIAEDSGLYDYSTDICKILTAELGGV